MPSARVQRRLAAIMATDIVGYARLIEADEARTLADIRVLRSDVIDPIVTDHGGRIVKLMGDGMIVEFGSVVDAVACAVAVQEAAVASREQVPPERRIVLRIGVALGDVVVEGDDLLGDGVNLAARLEGVAEPGGIYITDAAHGQLAGKLDAPFQDAGEHRLKNISQPVRVWRWIGSKDTGAVGTNLPLPDRPSVAVLPLDNLSGQPEETYFSDGITEDIITGLARFRSISVIARNSSFAFRGKSIDLADIGKRLGASYLVEGSVRRAGDRVRITAQLIDAATGVHIWAERFDRELKDVFEVQDEVARTIAARLPGRIEDAWLQQVLQKPTTSLAAYDSWLQGMAFFRGNAEDDNRRAYEMFERAASLDPQYALAHAYRAFVWVALHGYASAPAEVLNTAFGWASDALRLDPQESRCHRILANIWLYRRDYIAAEDHLRRAVELNPSDADARATMGQLFSVRGKPEEALAWLESAMRLNPLYPTWYNIFLGVIHYSLGRFEDAARALQRNQTLSYWSRARIAACYAQMGREKEAEAQAHAVLKQKPDFSVADFLERDVMLEREDDRLLLRQGLLKAGLPP